jgi:V8-like Glu-specific endopeptidase
MRSFLSMRGLPRTLAAAILLVAVPPAFTGPTNNMAEQARKSIVYVFFDVTDADTGAKAAKQGTGFVVSSKRHVLTAAHLFKDWKKQRDTDKANNPIRGTLGDKPGKTRYSPLDLELINPGDPDFNDVALLQFPDDGNDYAYAPICFQEELKLKVGDDLDAFGFPEGSSFQPIPVRLGTQNAKGGRYAATSAFTFGMSGGPVYSRGFVIGIVKGGLRGTDAVRWITPISFAKNVLLPPFVEQCDPTPSAPSAQTCRHPSHGVEKYQRTFDVARDSNWMGGGYDQTRWCNDVIAALRGAYPQGAFSVMSRGEESESKCRPFNCPQYKYKCSIRVEVDPLFKEMASAACTATR